MTSDKENISLLADIFVKTGLTDIVISPGSRNAPIILSFANRLGINAFSIVDERSAAFFALGLALNSKKAVALACTSGSAVLNYASAISEAFYQKIPLLILTADRPPHLIDVGDGQTIRQKNIYKNYIKNSYELPVTLSTKQDISIAEKIINQAINDCVFPEAGPVHINIPFDEPIYGTTDKQVIGTITKFNNNLPILLKNQLEEIAGKWNNSKKVMIIAGQAPENKELLRLLKKLSENNNIVILTETTSNLYNEKFIDSIDNVVSTIGKNEIEDYIPELLITFGGQVVSKMIKKFIRNNKPQTHLHISPSDEKMDTYFCLTDVVVSDVVTFFNSIINYLKPTDSTYFNLWKERKNTINDKRKKYLSLIEYSDLQVIDNILKRIPADSILHLGNSTPVRYSQLFGNTPGVIYNSNRGVSGIDGQVSTAAGYAYSSNKLNVLITGDLGFLYDSNGLMNKYLKPNLKIIVINNSGGGIFKFIPGPDTTPNLEEFFVAKHNWDAKHICKAFDVPYLKVENITELKRILPVFFISNEQTAEVLEIFTPSDKNAEILRGYFEFIKG